VFVSRKNLSRTVIEGGRYYSNSYFRRGSHGIERATTRQWLEQIALDVEEADARVVPVRPHVGKMFRDKLAPAHRWLVSQVGRPWSKVYSELCARFDTRTVAGRHVVYDHMLDWVKRAEELQRRHSRYDLVVDAHGILRKGPWFGNSYPRLRAAVLAWAAGRVCANTYRGWWWFRREGIGRPGMLMWQCSSAHVDIAGARYHKHQVKLVAERALSRKQVRYLGRVPDDFRHLVVVASPWPSR
jgi:hypothetical protein